MPDLRRSEVIIVGDAASGFGCAKYVKDDPKQLPGSLSGKMGAGRRGIDGSECLKESSAPTEEPGTIAALSPKSWEEIDARVALAKDIEKGKVTGA